MNETNGGLTSSSRSTFTGNSGICTTPSNHNTFPRVALELYGGTSGTSLSNLNNSISLTNSNILTNSNSMRTRQVKAAVIKLGRKDPVAYADETGPVTWEIARDHVMQVLENHSK